MNSAIEGELVRFALPKGRMYDQVVGLMADSGIRVSRSERDYRPNINLDGFNTKILKPRNVIGMLAEGARDIGFAGNDWVKEMNADLVELLDTKLNPVRLVVAVPSEQVASGEFPKPNMIVASEYVELANGWINQKEYDAKVLTTFGATEVFPPEDADCIIDNTATGSTLRANNLTIVDEVMKSSTRLYANPRSLENAVIRDKVDTLVMLLKSVLEARERIMLDLNVAASNLDSVVACLPCMRKPTISSLHNNDWYAIRSAVRREELVGLIPLLKSHGACDIVTSLPGQIIP